jgi:hypothetical protein
VTLFFLAGSSTATEYFVNDASIVNDVPFPGCETMDAGTDAPGCGTCAAPCRSLQVAYDQLPLKAGDTVYINSGTYTAGSAVPILKLWDENKAGTATNMLTFRGPTDTNGRAALIGGAPLALLDGEHQATAGVVISVPGIRLQGLGIARTHQAPPCFGTTECGSGVRIMLPYVIPSFELVGLDISDFEEVTENAIDIDQDNTTCEHCLIENSHFHNSSASWTAIWVGGLSGLTLRGNIIEGFRDGRTGAIELAGVSNSFITNNVIRNCGGPAVSVRYCVTCSTGEGEGIQIINNTFRHNQQLNPSSDSAEVRITSGNNHVVRNNIINPDRARALYLDASATATINYNGYYLEGGAALGMDGNTDHATLAAWQGTLHDLQSLETDPLFASASDSHLQSPAGYFDRLGTFSVGGALSPFVDRGDPTSSFSLERGPHGGRVDLGAYGNTPENSLTPVQLTMLAGDGQTGFAGAVLPEPLSVKLVYASNGSPAPGTFVAFEATLGDGGTSDAGALTDAEGKANVLASLGSVGENRYVASVAAADAGTVTFVATAIDSMDTGDAGTAPRNLLPVRVGCGAVGVELGSWLPVALAMGAFLQGQRRRRRL